jgi:transposase
MNVTTAGIDLARNAFSVHGVDAHGKVVVVKTVSRSKLLESFANLPAAILEMEACSGAHRWARTQRSLGHDARIIAPPCALPPSSPSNSRPSSACIGSAAPSLPSAPPSRTSCAA